MAGTAHRLNKEQMAEVMKLGHFITLSPLSLKLWRDSSSGPARYGVVVSGKKVKRAVDRNRLKRRGRAVLSSLYPQFVPSAWVAVFLDSRSLDTDFADFTGQVKMLLTKAKII